MSIRQQVAQEAAKASPPIGVMAAHILGVNWSDVAYMLTSVYTLALLAHLMWKWRRARKSHVPAE